MCCIIKQRTIRIKNSREHTEMNDKSINFKPGNISYANRIMLGRCKENGYYKEIPQFSQSRAQTEGVRSLLVITHLWWKQKHDLWSHISPGKIKQLILWLRRKKVINDQVCVIKSSLLECVTAKIIQSSNIMSEFKSFSRRVYRSKWLQPSIVFLPHHGDLILIQISM